MTNKDIQVCVLICSFFLLYFRLSDKARLLKSSTPAVSPITTPAKQTEKVASTKSSPVHQQGDSMDGLEPIEQSNESNVCETLESMTTGVSSEMDDTRDQNTEKQSEDNREYVNQYTYRKAES